jgi:sodium-dependent phosphate transporter
VGGVLGIIISWIIAPLVAGISSFLLFGATKMTLLRPTGSKLRTLQAMPLYYGVTVMVVMSSILYKVIYFQAICSSEACSCRFL